MASSMIHYIVSRLIADEIGVKDLNMFLVGAVLEIRAIRKTAATVNGIAWIYAIMSH